MGTSDRTRLRLAAVCVFLVAWVLVATPVLADIPQEAVGFTPNHILSSGAFGEYIDEMNGAVNLTIPMSPTYHVGPRLSYQLTLHYTSIIWQVKDWGNTLGAIPRVTRDGPFGAGFALHLGRIEPEVANPGAFSYVAPDGSSHLIPWLNDLDTGVTSDGTFIKAQAFRSSTPPYGITTWTLTFPDLTTAHFMQDPSDINGHTFRVAFLQGPPEEPMSSGARFRVDITYEAPPTLESPDNPSTPTPWQPGTWRCIHEITDSLGRTITFTNVATARGGRTTQIRQPVFDLTPSDPAPTADWSFAYSGPLTLTAPDGSRSESDHDLLTQVTLPAPGSPVLLGFDYADGGSVTDGMLRRRYLPRQAGDPQYYMRYVYGSHSFLVWEWSELYNEMNYVSHQTRVLTSKELHVREPWNASDSVYTWGWSRTYESYGNPKAVTATDPDGNATVYKFHGNPDAAGHLDDGTYFDWQTGLPYRTEWYAGGATPGASLRIEIRNYEDVWFQPITGIAVEIPQAEELWTGKLGEAGYDWTVTRYMGFDEFGHAADVVTEGSAPGLFRRVHTNWTTTVDPPRWFLDSWDSRITYDEAGRVFSRVEASFDSIGRPLSSRSRVDPGGAQSSKDPLATYTYNSSTGLPESTTFSQGDTGPSYSSSYEYQARTFPARSRLGTFDWYAANRDVDETTGLTRRGLEPNDELATSPPAPGHPTADSGTFPYDTTYEWDAIGRLTAIRPPSVTATIVTYPTLWQTEVTQDAGGTAGTRKSIFKYDWLGRLYEERRQNKGGGFDARQTEYDWAGRVTRQSEWFACDEAVAILCDPSPASKPVTSFSYTWPGTTIQDPFGRARSITTPDNKTTTFDYTELSRTATVSVDDKGPATTKWTYDGFGRLVAVDAPIGADAHYEYDAGDRLTRAELTDGSTTQVRSFTYDALGRLRTSTTPEGGTVQVVSYDAGGRPVETIDAKGQHLVTTYDGAGRVLEVRNGGGTLLAKNTYDANGTGDPNRAKLMKTETFDEWGGPVPFAS